MNNSNDISRAMGLVNDINSNTVIKRIKKDSGLIERKDVQDKVILAEDNRQVIFG